MPDRQVLAEARALRAEIEQLRQTMVDLRIRQQSAVNEWESLIASLRNLDRIT